jgi:hypothetical protein
LLHWTCLIGVVLQPEFRRDLLLRIDAVSRSSSRLETSEGHCAELEQLSSHSSNKTHYRP